LEVTFAFFKLKWNSYCLWRVWMSEARTRW